MTVEDEAAVLKNLNSELLLQAAKMSDQVALLKEAAQNADVRGWLQRRRSAPMWGEEKWTKTFVILRSGQLHCHRKETDQVPYSSFVLNSCVLRNEGTRGKTKKYYVFSLHLAGAEMFSRGPNSGALVRLSADTQETALHWMEMLSKECFKSTATESEDVSEDTNALQDLPLPHLAKQMSKKSSLLKIDLSPQPKQRSAFSFPASRPVHKKATISILSADSTVQNYGGFFNLGVIILVVQNFRLIIENSLKYGLLLGTPSFGELQAWTSFNPVKWPCTTGFLLMQVHLLSALWIEKRASQGKISEFIAVALTVLNTTAQVVSDTALVWIFPATSLAGLIFMMMAVILMMKLISYAHVNRDLRLASKEGPASDILNLDAQVADVVPDKSDKRLCYPENLSLQNLYYFWFAPTLSYQLNYPRIANFRPSVMLALITRILIFSGIAIFVTTQYMMPAAESSVQYLLKGDYLRVFEHLLKMAIPSTYIWLLGFYVFFHLYLNLLAEVLRFGDREFYKDWWNSTSFEAYWRLWNTPVHYWVVRHVYFPVMRMGFGKNIATFWVFFVSAVLHELVISVPFKMVRLYAFLGMMGQIPLIFFTKSLGKKMGEDSQVGNYFFWLAFCIFGQPMAIMMYYFDYYRQYSQQAGSCK